MVGYRSRLLCGLEPFPMLDSNEDERDTVEEFPPFDAEKAVATYRRAFTTWERTGAGQVGLKLMRQHWQDRHGKDSLHQFAFGGP